VILLSVKGIPEKDTLEVLNRFIQAPIEEKTPDLQKTKGALMFSNYRKHKDVRDEPMAKYVKAALDIIYYNSFEVGFEEPDEETTALLDGLCAKFLELGFNLTQVGQFYSLCECAAFQKRYYRDSPDLCRIEVEDIEESWFLLNRFARETVTKLTAAALNIFDQITPLTDEEIYALGLNPEHYPPDAHIRNPTQTDIIRRTGRSKGTVSDALRAGRPEDSSTAGTLIRSGLVYSEWDPTRNTVIYRRTNDAATVPKVGGVSSFTVGAKTYQPADPCGEIGSLEFAQVRGLFANLGKVELASILGSEREIEELVSKFGSSEEYKRGVAIVNDLIGGCLYKRANLRTSTEEDQVEVQKTSNPQDGGIEVRNDLRTSANLADEPDQTTIAQDIKEILTEAKKAHLAVNDAQQLAQAVAIKVKKRHETTTMLIANIEQHYNHLAETDPTIQGLIADCTRGA
jgi:succinate dehydrogenase flavin-adding protein (antitoxin of CptAB toxin-antitoxin module)